MGNASAAHVSAAARREGAPVLGLVVHGDMQPDVLLVTLRDLAEREPLQNPFGR